MAAVGGPLEGGSPTSILHRKFVEEWGDEESEALVGPEEGVDITWNVEVACDENQSSLGRPGSGLMGSRSDFGSDWEWPIRRLDLVLGKQSPGE